MAKVPRAGRVKTRLAGEVGTVAALSFYRANLEATLWRLSAPRRWRTTLALTPDLTDLRDIGLGALPPLDRRPQGGGDLGARMERLLGRWRTAGPRVLVGADIPHLTTTHIAAAFDALSGQDAVLGPAPDGGFWLIGLAPRRRLRRGTLSGVRWSSPHARADTRRALAAAGLGRVVETACLDDVDDAAAFATFAQTAGRVVVPSHLR